MRVRALLLPLLLAACATTAGGRAEPVVGTWNLRTLNARALPAPSPDEAGVRVDAAALRLEPAGAFHLRMQARTQGSAGAVNRSLDGAYRVAADTLILTPGDGGDALRFRFAARGGVLLLTDPRGNAYAFARTAGP